MPRLVNSVRARTAFPIPNLRRRSSRTPTSGPGLCTWMRTTADPARTAVRVEFLDLAGPIQWVATASPSASAASSQNWARQETQVASMPGSTGPSAAPRSAPAAWARAPCARAEPVGSCVMTHAEALTTAAAMPCTIRAPTSSGEVGARAATAEPAARTPSPNPSVRCGPRRVARANANGTVAAQARVKPAITQVAAERSAGSSRWIDGSRMMTPARSRTTVNEARATSVSRRR